MAPSASSPFADIEESFTTHLNYELELFVNRVELFFEPWKEENHCRGKAFQGTLEQLPVIIKLWDGYKIPVKKRDNEAKVYMVPLSLWGKVYPEVDWDQRYRNLLGDIYRRN